jgi:hypothetical protein
LRNPHLIFCIDPSIDYWRELSDNSKTEKEFYDKAKKPEVPSDNHVHDEPAHHPNGITD